MLRKYISKTNIYAKSSKNKNHLKKKKSFLNRAWLFSDDITLLL